MVRKTCPGCGRKSYSASDTGKWECPYCGKDISGVPAEPAGARMAEKSRWPVNTKSQTNYIPLSG